MNKLPFIIYGFAVFGLLCLALLVMLKHYSKKMERQRRARYPQCTVVKSNFQFNKN
jgi:hypothetical protein